MYRQVPGQEFFPRGAMPGRRPVPRDRQSSGCTIATVREDLEVWLSGSSLGIRERRVGPQERGDHFVDVLVEVGAGQRAARLQQCLVLVQAQDCIGKGAAATGSSVPSSPWSAICVNDSGRSWRSTGAHASSSSDVTVCVPLRQD
jgi:hypothetical protein